MCSDPASSPWVALKAFNCGTWHGQCVAYDRTDSRVPPASVNYNHTVCESGMPLELTSTTVIQGSDAPVLHPLRLSSTTDVDLDGSFSDQHAGERGLLHARALLEATHGAEAHRGAKLVLEHTLAISDTERWRCLLVYGEPPTPAMGGNEAEAKSASPAPYAASPAPVDTGDSVLRQLLLLTERRAVASLNPPLPLSQPSLDALVGTWVGDACARAPKDAALPPGAPSDVQFFGHVSTNVYNARLEYASRELWDGNRAVSRRLQFTSFGGEEMEPIVSSGAVMPDQDAADGMLTVNFGGSDGVSMFLLPGGAHVMAPTRIGSARPFSTEFSALLAPGESFGWESYALQEAIDQGSPPTAAAGGGVSRGVFPTLDAAAINEAVSPGNGAPRLARVQRLYLGRETFVSGTTSLLSAVGGA
jgi:hypothetical protein